MIQGIFKTNNWTFNFIIIVCFIIQSCNSGENKVSYNEDERDKSTDSIRDGGNITVHSPGNRAFNSLPNENAERQKLIIMQIDSTYAAISLLDDLKKDVNAESATALTMAERNKKSKAIFNINIIQNELTRALDASILANLKTRTDELAGITRELEKNVNHLQDLTASLNKATKTISRLIDILALGLSNGWIKPMTPKGTAPEIVKAAVK